MQLDIELLLQSIYKLWVVFINPHVRSGGNATKSQNKQSPQESGTTTLDQRGSFTPDTAVSQQEQCRDRRSAWKESFLGSLQGPSTGFVEGRPETQRDGSGKHPDAVGSFETKVHPTIPYFGSNSSCKPEIKVCSLVGYSIIYSDTKGPLLCRYK